MAIAAHLRRLLPALLTAICLVASAAPARALDRRLTDSVAEADALFHDGDLDGAVEKMEETRTAALALLGAEHADVGEITARLALLEMYRNRIDRASELAEDALRIREKAYGELHPDVAASLLDLASIRLIQGRKTEAGALYERILDVWTRMAGAKDPRTAQARANLAEFYEATGRLADAQSLRDAEPPTGAETTLGAEPAPACPLPAKTLALPPWNPQLVADVIRVALEHEKRVAYALEASVHRFSGTPSRAEFDALFDTDGAAARDLALHLRKLADARDPALASLLALTLLARERVRIATLERLAPTPGAVPDYGALAADVRRRVLIGVTRFELTRTPGWAQYLGDVGTLLARRDKIAQLVRPIGFDVNNEIKYRPEFTACVVIALPDDDFDYAALRDNLEIIARNARAISAWFRFSGIDPDATLKTYARGRRGAGVEQLGAGVSADRFNKIVYLDAYPTTFAIHLDEFAAYDRDGDLAALLSQWEHGQFPAVSRKQLETLLEAARERVDPGAFADLLNATLLDLRTRYSEIKAGQPTWSQPRIGRWERSLVGREQYHTYYEMQFDTHGSYAVPTTSLFTDKRLTSPIGVLLAIGLRNRDLPKRALDAFAKRPPALHVAVLPDPGLTFELYAHPRALTRTPGVTAIAAGETPLKPPPAAGWEIDPFGRVRDDGDDEDHVLLDVRPVPGISPEDPKTFGLHVCLLTPLDAHADGNVVTFDSPVWRTTHEIPDSARFLVYRREKGRKGWSEIAGVPLGLTPGLDYPQDRVSPIEVAVRDGFVELSLEDRTAKRGVAYEYLVLHRCALRPYPDKPPAAPATGASFEVIAVERAPAGTLTCNLRQGYAGIARPWVKVRYRVRGASGAWRDTIEIADPDGHELGNNAITTRRDPAPGSGGPGTEYSVQASIAACTEGPYRFKIGLKGDGFSEEIEETLQVRVARER